MRSGFGRRLMSASGSVMIRPAGFMTCLSILNEVQYSRNCLSDSDLPKCSKHRNFYGSTPALNPAPANVAPSNKSKPGYNVKVPHHANKSSIIDHKAPVSTQNTQIPPITIDWVFQHAFFSNKETSINLTERRRWEHSSRST